MRNCIFSRPIVVIDTSSAPISGLPSSHAGLLVVLEIRIAVLLTVDSNRLREWHGEVVMAVG
jgi:hypothetical protein